VESGVSRRIFFLIICRYLDFKRLKPYNSDSGLSYRLGARAAAIISRASEISDNRIKAPICFRVSLALVGVWSGRTTGLHFCTEDFWFPGFVDSSFMFEKAP
jgi:hypothetical protein